MEQRHHHGVVEHTHPTENLTNAFATARHDLMSLEQDPDFLSTRMIYGVKNEQDNPVAYWQVVAQYQWDRAHSGEYDSLTADSIVLAGATPDAIVRQLALEGSPSRNEARDHKRALSRYNGLIREFGTDHPHVSVRSVEAELRKVAASTVAGDFLSAQTSADALLRQIIRGTQHELAFGQILEASGMEYRPSTIEEDLKGADYIVTLPDGRTISVDVKASLSEIDFKNRGSNTQPYTVSPEGKLTIYSCVDDRDFHDSFAVSSELAATRVPVVLGALFQASQRIAS